MACPRVPLRFSAFVGYETEPQFDSMLSYERFIELWTPNSMYVPYFAGERDTLYRPHEINGLPPTNARREDGSLGRFDHTLFPQFYDTKHPWWPFMSPPPDEIHNCEIDWQSFEHFWHSSAEKALPDEGSINPAFVTTLMRRANALEDRLRTLDHSLDANHELRRLRPDPIDTTVLGSLKSPLSFYVALDLVTRLQRQFRETRAFLHYAEVVKRYPRYTALSFPEENNQSQPLPLSTSGYIGVWANHMDIWDICWYARMARVAVFFASELSLKEFHEIRHHAKVCSSTEMTRVERLKYANSTPYALLHRRYDTTPPPLMSGVNYAAFQGIPPRKPLPDREKRTATSRNQGWVGFMHPAESNKVSEKVDYAIRGRLLVQYQSYVEERQRLWQPTSVVWPRHRTCSTWEEWGTHVDTDEMGPWQGAWEGAWDKEPIASSSTASDEPALPSYQPEARTLPTNYTFRPLDRVFIDDDASRIPWIKPPPVALKTGKTRQWDIFLLIDITDCPDEVEALRKSFPYAFKRVGKNNELAKQGGTRWYDRRKNRILMFPTGGRLVFPMGLKNQISTFGAPVPNYPFFIEHGNRLTFVSSSYWMYQGQVEQKGGINPIPPSIEEMEKVDDVGENRIREDTKWIEEDEYSSDDDGPPFAGTRAMNDEDADPVPPYMKQEQLPHYVVRQDNQAIVDLDSDSPPRSSPLMQVMDSTPSTVIVSPPTSAALTIRPAPPEEVDLEEGEIVPETPSNQSETPRSGQVVSDAMIVDSDPLPPCSLANAPQPMQVDLMEMTPTTALISSSVGAALTVRQNETLPPEGEDGGIMADTPSIEQAVAMEQIAPQPMQVDLMEMTPTTALISSSVGAALTVRRNETLPPEGEDGGIMADTPSIEQAIAMEQIVPDVNRSADAGRTKSQRRRIRKVLQDTNNLLIRLGINMHELDLQLTDNQLSTATELQNQILDAALKRYPHLHLTPSTEHSSSHSPTSSVTPRPIATGASRSAGSSSVPLEERIGAREHGRRSLAREHIRRCDRSGPSRHSHPTSLMQRMHNEFTSSRRVRDQAR